MKPYINYRHSHSANRITGTFTWWYTCTGNNGKKEESYPIAEFAYTIFPDGKSEKKRVI